MNMTTATARSTPPPVEGVDRAVTEARERLSATPRPEADPARVSGSTANTIGAVFYGVVALVAFAGQTLAAVDWLGWPLPAAMAAVAALELGGIALAARADFRRRLGERAIAARVLSGAVAAFAVVFNWAGHAGTDDLLAGAFFAGMSGLGYGVWLINAGDRRRDQLRADGKLPPTAPAYGLWQWLRHPHVTRRALALAKADPTLGLYGSLAVAEAAIRAEKRTRAIVKVLRRKLTAAVDRTTAEIAVRTYDLDEIARRLAASADYDGLTALIAADLAPDRLAGERPVDDAGGPVIEAPADPSEPATVAVIRPPFGGPDDGQDAATEPVTRPVRKAPRTAPAKRQQTGVRVAKAAARMPGASAAAIARKAGVSESTARRYLPSPNGGSPAVDSPIGDR